MVRAIPGPAGEWRHVGSGPGGGIDAGGQKQAINMIKIEPLPLKFHRV